MEFRAGSLLGIDTSKVIGAADVGYGYTKFGFANGNGNTVFHLSKFPSIASTVTSGDKDPNLVRLESNHDLVEVEANGLLYSVGPDSDKSQGERVLSDSYIEQNEHLALLKGALKYSGKEHFDIYVVGLPVTHMRNRSMIENLKHAVRGEHDLGDGQTCRIDNVIVLPQPQGGYLSYAFESDQYAQLKRDRTLVLDPGHWTHDWLIVQNNSPIEHLCGSHNHSMSRILKDVSRNISNKLSFTFDSLPMLERSIESKTIRLKRQDYELQEFFTDTTYSLIKDSVQRVRNELEEVELIEHIVLCGGAGELFVDAVEECFGIKAPVSNESIFNNLKGYLLAGLLTAEAGKHG